MNDSNSAIEETITLAVPPDGGAETAAPQPERSDLRGAILSGRFLGLHDRSIEDAKSIHCASPESQDLMLIQNDLCPKPH